MTPDFELKLAETADDIRAAQRLRYRVFVEELGGGGDLVDHDARLETDAFDAHCDHLLLFDRNNQHDDGVVGVYRVLRSEVAEKSGGFYSEREYDLTRLINSRRKLLELGRSCLLPSYRGGAAMYHLWNGLSEYVTEHEIEVLFGVASFHGTDPTALAAPLSLLHHRHLAPAELRPSAIGENAVSMNMIPEAQVDRRKAMLEIPALIKAYLRLGGMVGEGAWIDRAFNTTDVCLLLDTARMNTAQKAIYTKGDRA